MFQAAFTGFCPLAMILKKLGVKSGAAFALTRRSSSSRGCCFATASVVLLVMLSMGRREAVVVGAAVTVPLVATLFASWAWGFTINRVSLFALIFSIGILVDDAIVIVENIHRHL